MLKGCAGSEGGAELKGATGPGGSTVCDVVKGLAVLKVCAVLKSADRTLWVLVAEAC